jgi:uncharacterized spore protein YtfJ
MELEDRIVIPIAKMDMAFGANMVRAGPDMSREGQQMRAVGGGGVGVSPIAVVIVFKGISGPEGVKVALLSPPGKSLSDIAQVFKEK